MAVIWQNTFPELIEQGAFQERGPENVRRFETESGIAVTQRKSTAAVRLMSLAHVAFTDAQVAAFEQFVRDDLKDGALTFEMPHPRTSVTAEFRMRAPYTITANGRFWRVAIEVEQMP